MFTGIVEELGTVESIAPSPDGARVRIRAAGVLEGAGLGDSTAVNGCCLTIVALDPAQPPTWWEADVSDETLARTSFGQLQPGDPVNLERPVRLMDRLGGHLVQGHVDAVGEVVRPVPDLAVRVPDHLLRYIVEKGSITVDGVSLTVVEPLPDGFTVAVIPHTSAVTTLGARRPGDLVNLEADVIAKYTERLLAFGPTVPDATENPLEA